MTTCRRWMYIVASMSVFSMAFSFTGPALLVTDGRATNTNVLLPTIPSLDMMTVEGGRRRTLSILYAKKTLKSRNERSGSSGSGFGVASSKTSSSSLSTKLQGKVRTVSGFSGSGTKPLRQAANTFDEIRKRHGKEACWDLYCKSPLDDPYRLWFIGKVAVIPNTAATPTQAVLSQKRIILEYAKRELRPQNLGLPKYADTLELWLAPGDSELECVQNKISLDKVEGSLADLLDDDFSIDHVGFNPEIYVGDEREQGGLRITRDDNGAPMKPVFEVNESA